MNEASATTATSPHGVQYSSARAEARTALSGMWLFLASEVQFFGALFLAWIYCRHWAQAGFDAGARHTDLTIGTINTVILLSSSLLYSVATACIAAGRVRGLVRCCAGVWLLGLAFLVLKFGFEWHSDLSQHLFPGPQFAIQGALRGGAELFYSFYFISTALHGLHMAVGLGLLAWIIRRARRGEFHARYYTPVAAVGLYWSFVDMVWIVLYPLIYLVGRGP